MEDEGAGENVPEQPGQRRLAARGAAGYPDDEGLGGLRHSQ